MSGAVAETELHFSRPWRSVLTMLIIIGLVGAGVWFAYPKIGPIFTANIYLNGVISGVFVIGVFACFWQVLGLVSAVGWIEGFAAHREGHEFVRPPRMLVSLATLLKSRRGAMQISATSSQSILDSMATRLDEGREITRFISNLLIFLGLLGTFYGLATTVPAVVDTIRSLAPSDSEGGVEVFGRLMNGLEKQLGGMGTAFSSSLLGLAGSLVVGLLDLFAGQSQNRYYREIEEWLSTITRVGVGAGDGEVPAIAVGGVTDTSMIQMTDSIDMLQENVARTESTQRETAERIGQLVEVIQGLAERIADEHAQPRPDGTAEQTRLLAQIAELNAAVVETQSEESARDRAAILEQTQILAQIADGQDALSGLVTTHSQLLKKQTEILQQDTDDPNEWQIRTRLENIHVDLLRIFEEMSAGRQDTLVQIQAQVEALRAATLSLGRKGAVQHQAPPQAANRKA